MLGTMGSVERLTQYPSDLRRRATALAAGGAFQATKLTISDETRSVLRTKLGQYHPSRLVLKNKIDTYYWY